MEKKMTLKERFDIAAQDAQEALEALLACDLERDEFRALVRRFTLAKFFLTEEEVAAAGTEDLLKLANESVEKILRENDRSVKLAEGSTTCTNQSSTDIKKVLLSMTLQRGLGIRFTPEESADLTTITELADGLFYRILGEATGLEIADEEGLLPCMVELAAIKKKYEKYAGALDEVAATGYGIVMPTMEELHLEEPEIMKQGGRYGIRLRASAPSIHLMQANITTEVAPIVGSERQSEELVHYLLQEFEENPAKIWESNIFGKSLHELVNEGLHNKLYRMPADARMKLQETIERVINEGCSGLICIIL